LFPSMTSSGDAKCRVQMNAKLLLGVVFPVAFLLSAGKILNNAAYLHSSLAFLQMMRGSGVAFSYIVAVYLMVERLDGSKVMALGAVLFATALTIYGEDYVAFSMFGFVLQGMALASDSVRGGLQIFLLNKAGWKLDALSYMLLVMPVSLILLSVSCGTKDVLGLSTSFSGPNHLDALNWSWHLIANSCLSFLASLLSITLCEHASTTGFSIVGVARDAMIVCVGASFFQEALSLMQGVGFSGQLAAAFWYAMVQVSPEKVLDKLPISDKQGSTPQMTSQLEHHAFSKVAKPHEKTSARLIDGALAAESKDPSTIT